MEVTVGLSDVKARFSQLRGLEGSVGQAIHELISDVAEKINGLAQESPALMSIIQHLEQASHVAVRSPNMQDQLADPTSADQAGSGSAASSPAGSPPETTSTDSPSSSAGGSTA